MWKTLTLLTAVVLIGTTRSSSAESREDAYVACLIGQAGVSLHKQLGQGNNAGTATEAAMKYADKRCKGKLSDGGHDYVYHSISAMARAWYNEERVEEPAAQVGPKSCDGELVGPNGTVGSWGMRLGPEWAVINLDSTGYEGCFFQVNGQVGKAILENCTVGHRCLVAGAVKYVRGAIGNAPGGPAVSVLTQVITAVDITTIEEKAKCTR